MSWNLTLAVAKGRILQGTENLLRDAGFDWPNLKSSRHLWFPASDRRPGLIVARAKDIPTLVSRGIADLGVVGLDILREYPDAEVLEVSDLKFASCRVVLASQEADWPKGPSRIATKYQRIARQYFAEHRHPIEIVSLSGSLELAPLIGLAPYIVDIVDTGQTLREHGLVEVTTILQSSARLIANSAHWRTNPGVLTFRNTLAQHIRKGV